VVFKEVFKHETVVTKSIHDLVELAEKERDHASVNFLQWFVKEQVEEESNADEIVKKLEMACDAPGALLMLDHDLGKRGQD
jgi:ferritin